MSDARKLATDTYLHDAARCGECHNKMLDEWRESGHAKSLTSPTFLAMRKAAGDPQECQRCHQPLLAHAGPKEPVVAEGVTCDVCHTMSEVEVEEHGSSFVLDVSTNVKYGPRCNLKRHYFHDMGCSPLHETAEQCAACHNWYRDLKTGTMLPVFTTYPDWLAGPYPKEGKQCQSCHMPGTTAILAEGSPERSDVPHHGQFGADGSLRKRAVQMSVEVRDAGARVQAAITLANVGSGHFVPAGLPARRLVVRLDVLTTDGKQMASDERAFGRVLNDSGGKVVPFFMASRVASDTRIGPRQERTSTATLDAPGPGVLRVRLLWRPMAHAVAKLAKVPRLEDELLAETTIPFGAPASGGRKGLPHKVIDNQ